MSTLCQTTSGPYRCAVKTDADGKHVGPCEAQAREYAASSAFVSRNGFYYDTCKVHALSKHRGGKCIECETKP